MAEKKAREARVLYSGDQDNRWNRGIGMNPMAMGYRPPGFNVWTASGAPAMPPYGPPKSGNWYVGHDPSSPIRSKSPPSNFDAESETSSHSRSSVRVRDDVPPPYPIEGVNSARKYRSPASSSDNAVDYKPLSPPSPVSSSSSRLSRATSRSLSRSRSRSSRSSSYSSDSAVSSQQKKRKRSKRTKRKRGQKEKQRSKDFPSPAPSPPLQRSSSSLERRLISPRKSPDMSTPAAPIPDRNILLSSGNESISSDELPYFPDEDDEVSQKAVKTKLKSKRSGESCSSSSSSSLHKNPSKRHRKDSSASISSSELIYSPTRTQATAKPAGDDDCSSDSSSSSSQTKAKPKKRRRKSSSGKSSPSSYDFPPVSPVRAEEFSPLSPHRPTSPVSYPPLPDDMSGFQPPLPQDPVSMPPLPPMPQKRFPPSPPALLTYELEADKKTSSPFSEIEEGEVSSSPEQYYPVEPHTVDKNRNISSDTFTLTAPPKVSDKSLIATKSIHASDTEQSVSDVDRTLLRKGYGPTTPPSPCSPFSDTQAESGKENSTLLDVMDGAVNSSLKTGSKNSCAVLEIKKQLPSTPSNVDVAEPVLRPDDLSKPSDEPEATLSKSYGTSKSDEEPQTIGSAPDDSPCKSPVKSESVCLGESLDKIEDSSSKSSSLNKPNKPFDETEAIGSKPESPGKSTEKPEKATVSKTEKSNIPADEYEAGNSKPDILDKPEAIGSKPDNSRKLTDVPEATNSKSKKPCETTDEPVATLSKPDFPDKTVDEQEAVGSRPDKITDEKEAVDLRPDISGESTDVPDTEVSTSRPDSPEAAGSKPKSPSNSREEPSNVSESQIPASAQALCAKNARKRHADDDCHPQGQSLESSDNLGAKRFKPLDD